MSLSRSQPNAFIDATFGDDDDDSNCSTAASANTNSWLASVSVIRASDSDKKFTASSSDCTFSPSNKTNGPAECTKLVSVGETWSPTITIDPERKYCTGTGDNNYSDANYDTVVTLTQAAPIAQLSAQFVNNGNTCESDSPAPTANDVPSGVIPPTATVNTNSLSQGDVSVSGNMLTDDDGAGVDSSSDGEEVTAVSGGDNYGTLSWVSAGSYTYTLNNSNADVSGLAAGESLTEVYTYTVENDNGFSSNATLTITINGPAAFTYLSCDINSGDDSKRYGVELRNDSSGSATLSSLTVTFEDASNRYKKIEEIWLDDTLEIKDQDYNNSPATVSTWDTSGTWTAGATRWLVIRFNKDGGRTYPVTINASFDNGTSVVTTQVPNDCSAGTLW